jgi:putative hydrolase of the HAD superfamily
VIRAVVSDFGGVLTVPLMHAFAQIQADLGIAPEAFGAALATAAAADGRNPLHAVEVGAISEAEFIATLERELAGALGRPVALHGFAQRYMGALAPNAPFIEHLRTLRERGLRLALCTNNVREWEPLWRAKLPVDELFEIVVDSGFAGVRKPDPAIYALVLDRLGLPAGACVFVDDLERNVDAARELGFATVHFRDTDQAIADLDRAVAG